MAPSEPTTQALSIHDIAALSDAELDLFLEKNRRPEGGFELEVDWTELPNGQRDIFAQRLRARAQKVSDTIQSRPVNSDQLNARLLQMSADRDTSPRALSRPLRHERSPTRSPLPRVSENREIECYNELVNNGGWPAYPISLLDEVFENVEEYREILRPWQEYPNSDYLNPEVFRIQLYRWLDFCVWQQDNRGIDGDDDGFVAFVERTKRLNAASGTSGDFLSRLEDPSRLKRAWENEQDRRRWEQDKIWEVYGDDGFPKYVEVVKRRLAQHGFPRTFQLKEDPKQQDKLTTWIEYLNYEYCWYDRYTRVIKALQPQYDVAWKELVDSGVLRPSETDKYLRSMESGSRRESEKQHARKAVESAKSAAMAAIMWAEKARNDPLRSSLTRQERTRRLAQAEARLNAAKASLKSLHRRSELITTFIRGTWNYKTAERNVERQSILLQWILEQAPLIEAELNQSKAAEGSSHVGRGAKRRLGRDQDDGVTKDRRPAKRKRSDEISSLSDGPGSLAQARQPSKRGRHDDTTDDERSSKRLRNNGQDPNSHDAISISGSPGSGIPARNQDDLDQAAMKTGKILRNRPLGPTDIPQAPAISQQPRRSSRIACQRRSGITVASPRAVKISRQRPRRNTKRTTDSERTLVSAPRPGARGRLT